MTPETRSLLNKLGMILVGLAIAGSALLIAWASGVGDFILNGPPPMPEIEWGIRVYVEETP